MLGSDLSVFEVKLLFGLLEMWLCALGSVVNRLNRCVFCQQDYQL